MTVSITGEIENVGDAEGTINLVTKGQSIASWTLGPGESETVDEGYTYDEVGLYRVELGEERITVNVGDVETYTLTVTTDGQGTVDIDPDQDEYEEGTTVTLTANPADGWEFAEWQGTDETGETITITIDDDMEITAVFEEEEDPIDDDDDDDDEEETPGFTLAILAISAIAAVLLYRKKTLEE